MGRMGRGGGQQRGSAKKRGKKVHVFEDRSKENKNKDSHPTPVSTGHAFFCTWQSSEGKSVPVRDSFLPRGSGGAKEKAGAARPPPPPPPPPPAPTDAKPTTDRCCCFHQGRCCCCCSSLSSIAAEGELLLRQSPCFTVNMGAKCGVEGRRKQATVGRQSRAVASL